MQTEAFKEIWLQVITISWENEAILEKYGQLLFQENSALCQQFCGWSFACFPGIYWKQAG